MDNKLELKDICGYLPYGLMCYCSKYPKEPVNLTGIKTNGLFFFGEIGNADICIDEIKPILRPISDLTKQIAHKGDMFVPMVELAKRLYGIHFNFKFGVSNYGININIYDGDTYIHSYVFNPGMCGFRSLDYLNSIHFDYRGLINKELAIDVNTLDVNPYE